ncbi:MAG: d(CMP) kinase [Bdellovibrionales bacterium]
MSAPFVIAIDGSAGSGKTTLAKRLAKRFGFAHLSTGLLYRAVGYEVHRRGIDPTDEAACTKVAEELAQQGLADLLDNPALTNYTSGKYANAVNQFKGLRKALFDYQRNFPNGHKGAVLDGRDITSRIFPEAPAKLYVTANTEIRAKRRLNDLQKADPSVTYEAVLADVRTRDERDAWNIGSITPDALVLDTSVMNADETEAEAAAYIQTKLG